MSPPYVPNPVSAPSPTIREVPDRTPMFDGPMCQPNANGNSQLGNITRSWLLFFEQWPGATVLDGPIIGFIMNSGDTGTNVGPMLPAARTGTADVVTVVVKLADASIDLTFDIKQNGVSIFAVLPTIVAATVPGTLLEFDDFTVNPLPVTENDVFTIDISSGSTTWEFTAVLETAIVVTP